MQATVEFSLSGTMDVMFTDQVDRLDWMKEIVKGHLEAMLNEDFVQDVTVKDVKVFPKA